MTFSMLRIAHLTLIITLSWGLLTFVTNAIPAVIGPRELVSQAPINGKSNLVSRNPVNPCNPSQCPAGYRCIVTNVPSPAFACVVTDDITTTLNCAGRCAANSPLNMALCPPATLQFTSNGACQRQNSVSCHWKHTACPTMDCKNPSACTANRPVPTKCPDGRLPGNVQCEWDRVINTCTWRIIDRCPTSTVIFQAGVYQNITNNLLDNVSQQLEELLQVPPILGEGEGVESSNGTGSGNNSNVSATTTLPATLTSEPIPENSTLSTDISTAADDRSIQSATDGSVNAAPLSTEDVSFSTQSTTQDANVTASVLAGSESSTTFLGSETTLISAETPDPTPASNTDPSVNSALLTQTESATDQVSVTPSSTENTVISGEMPDPTVDSTTDLSGENTLTIPTQSATDEVSVTLSTTEISTFSSGTPVSSITDQPGQNTLTVPTQTATDDGNTDSLTATESFTTSSTSTEMSEPTSGPTTGSFTTSSSATQSTTEDANVQALTDSVTTGESSATLLNTDSVTASESVTALSTTENSPTSESATLTTGSSGASLTIPTQFTVEDGNMYFVTTTESFTARFTENTYISTELPYPTSDSITDLPGDMTTSSATQSATENGENVQALTSSAPSTTFPEPIFVSTTDSLGYNTIIPPIQSSTGDVQALTSVLTRESTLPSRTTENSTIPTEVPQPISASTTDASGEITMTTPIQNLNGDVQALRFSLTITLTATESTSVFTEVPEPTSDLTAVMEWEGSTTSITSTLAPQATGEPVLPET